MKYGLKTCAPIAAALILSLASAALADVSLPAIFSDNMVLQRGKKIPVWGKSDPGEKVTVKIGKARGIAVADGNGQWLVKLGKLKEGGPYDLTVTGKNEVQFKNVMIGEVWVCSGQSNMEWPTKLAKNGAEEVANAKHPEIRLFTVKKKVSDTPLRDCEGKWDECSPETVGDFSAVGYFFGRSIQKDLGVTVGLINTSWGGTPSEAWTSLNTQQTVPEFKPILDRWDEIIKNYPQALEQYKANLAKWKEEAAKAKAAGAKEPPQPQPPIGPDFPHRPATLYNGMISPLLPFAIRGAIWYQGESNAGRAYQYRTIFPAVISDWRAAWGRGDFPFLFVQLANFTERKADPADSEWAELREAQSMTLQKLRNTGQAVIIDIGEEKDIHPKNKQDVGRRLALAALKLAYGKRIVSSGPTVKKVRVNGPEIRISFDNIGHGLVAKGGDLKGFAIAGEDKKFVWAEAKIEKDSVVVSSPQVEKPVAVRYGWANNPEVSLYNSAGLPASPFRTDDWPGVTVEAK